MKYNDGSLSPILIPFSEAGYLQSLAIGDEDIQVEQEQLMRDYLLR
jgi:hypothetical protein